MNSSIWVLMTLNRFAELGGFPWSKFCRSMLLPLCLLLAQHGVLLHELSHCASGVTQEQGEDDHHRADQDHCHLCIAFAQLESVATTDVVIAGLLAGLSFQQVSIAAMSGTTSESPSERNRGPPTFL